MQQKSQDYGRAWTMGKHIWQRAQKHSTIAGVLFIRMGSKYQPLWHTLSTASVFSPYPNPPPYTPSHAFLLATSPQPLLLVLPFRLLSESSTIHLFLSHLCARNIQQRDTTENVLKTQVNDQNAHCTVMLSLLQKHVLSFFNRYQCFSEYEHMKKYDVAHCCMQTETHLIICIFILTDMYKK